MYDDITDVYSDLYNYITKNNKGSKDPTKRDYSTGKPHPNEQNRNERCSCGSGLKYKKCCGKY